MRQNKHFKDVSLEVVLCILNYFNNQNSFSIMKHKHFMVIKHLKLSE